MRLTFSQDQADEEQRSIDANLCLIELRMATGKGVRAYLDIGCLTAAEQFGEADLLRERAFYAVRFVVCRNGLHSFEWIADGDSRVGSVCGVVTVDAIVRCFSPISRRWGSGHPAALVELVRAPCSLTLVDGTKAKGFAPAQFRAVEIAAQDRAGYNAMHLCDTAVWTKYGRTGVIAHSRKRERSAPATSFRSNSTSAHLRTRARAGLLANFSGPQPWLKGALMEWHNRRAEGVQTATHRRTNSFLISMRLARLRDDAPHRQREARGEYAVRRAKISDVVGRDLASPLSSSNTEDMAACGVVR